MVFEGDFLPEERLSNDEGLFRDETLSATAFFIASDPMAIGAYKAISEAGLTVGQDLSIIGFDDIYTSQYLTPSLTTVKVYTDFMGETAVDVLVEQIKSKRDIHKKTLIPTKFMLRESCKKVN